MRCLPICFAALLLATPITSAADIAPLPREKVVPVPKMPMTGLAPAKPMFDACLYRYGVGTASKECQAFVDQSLGMYYSYVWIEAARAAETALTHDPECAYAWLVLHRVAGEVRPRRRDSEDQWSRRHSREHGLRDAAGQVHQVAARSLAGDGPQAHAEGEPPRATAHSVAAAREGHVAGREARRTQEEGAAVARRTAHALRGRRGRLVLARADRRRRQREGRLSTRRS